MASFALHRDEIRVLLLEDSDDDVRLFEIAVARAGQGRFRVTRADRLRVAIDLLRTNPFDVLVLDLSLPDSDGPGTFHAIRAVEPDSPIVVMTGDENDERAADLVKEGAQDVLIKGEYSDGSLARTLRHAVERRETQRELQEARETALTASRTKSEFVASVSHEIRTPLNAILGMSEVLLATELELDQQEYVRIVNRAGQSLLDLINAVLDFSQVETGTLKLREVPFSIRGLVETSCEVLAFDAHKKGLVVVCRISEEVPESLVGDPGRIRQILVNLLGNAIKFTAEGHIKVDVRCTAVADELEISVSDTGTGIAVDKQARIFDSFTQADGSVTREFGGTGLGLTISARLVEAMDGAIEVESTVGVGSTFRARIPLPASEAESGSEEPSPLPPSGLRALVVDDEALEREIVAEHLGNWGIDVDHASSGPEGLSMVSAAERDGCPFDLVFIECRMPGMDGFAMLAQLAQNPGCSSQIVMTLTTDHRRGDIQLCADSGLAGYLLKPLKETALRELVLAMTTTQPEICSAEEGGIELGLDEDSGLRILLAEDSNDNQLLIRAYLRDTPHLLRVVQDGLKAVEAFGEDDFDVVLMDVQMPVQDGLSATREIRALERRLGAPPTPIVALTANAFEGESEASLAAGCDLHVTKPISRKRLIELLASVDRPKAESDSKPIAPPRPRVEVAPEVAALVPGYLENRRRELPGLYTALGEGDFESIRTAAHNIKGTGGGYGCSKLSEIGAKIEAAAKVEDSAEVDAGLEQIAEFLATVEITN